LRPTLKRIDVYVIRWARRKFKRLRHKTKGARDWFERLRRANPTLFAHWQLCHGNGRTSGAVWIERFTYGSGSARRWNSSARLDRERTRYAGARCARDGASGADGV